jgi:hypothetical protein
MVKAKKGKAKEETKCSCDDPFTCQCGKRPPRPSRGHKWDSIAQEWGGKGHKQKGASGQIAQVSEMAKTTSVGLTKVQQWQKLPSALLLEVCQRQKRPFPKYENVEQRNDLFRYRVILPDTKKEDNDLFFVPAQAVKNEEQAKEEGALLALKSLTPTLPHERKLPEPYRTTWLNALEAGKMKNTDAATHTTKSDTSIPSPPDSKTSFDVNHHTNGVAAASSNLVMAQTYTSQAEKRKQQEEKKRERNARIRHHEAVRKANQPHPVFMSAQIRKQIESLLRDENFNLIEDEDEQPDASDDNNIGEVQAYVEQRLRGEGFTKTQTRTAFKECSKNDRRSNDTSLQEEQWEGVYETCLQWLLVQLNEDQLPVGYDPRGRTLDVIVAEGRQQPLHKSQTMITKEQQLFADLYGLCSQDVAQMFATAAKEQQHPKEIFWQQLKSAAEVEFALADIGDRKDNEQMLLDEIEALKAIFDSSCEIVQQGLLTTILVNLPESGFVLEVSARRGEYPSTWPALVLVRGIWSSFIGVAMNSEILKFMSSLQLGEPMVFELYGHVQDVLNRLNDLTPISLVKSYGTLGTLSGATHKPTGTEESVPRPKRSSFTRRGSREVKRQPRSRGPFWEIHPRDTPPATAFPNIPKLMERQRASLPAASARAEFLTNLKAADSGGRVLLVTGETGCGKKRMWYIMPYKL